MMYKFVSQIVTPCGAAERWAINHSWLF